MKNSRISTLCYLLLIFVVKIRLILGAEQVTNSTSNQGGLPSSVQSRFSDLGAMGFPNFGPERFGNPTSNYPTDSFFPFGNQNNNLHQLHPGLGYQNQNPNQGNFQNRPIQGGYPNQQGYPYQGDSMNPSTNYQRPLYPNVPNGNQGNFPNRPGPGGFGNRPIHGGIGNQNGFPYQGGSVNPYPNPNYQQPSYPSRPNGMSPGNRPYQNGEVPSNQGRNFNQIRPVQGRPGQSFQQPSQYNEYPSQGNFQGSVNHNLGPDQNVDNSFRPDDINDLVTGVNFPDRPNQNRPNQYDPQTESPNQNLGLGLGHPDSSEPNPTNYDPNHNIQYPSDSSTGDDDDSSTVQFPYPSAHIANPTVTGQPPLRPDNFDKILVNKPQLPNNQGMDPIHSNYNSTVAILGKPVVLAPTTTESGRIIFDISTENPSLKKCVQDCQATSEYNPVCGSNNVTYINPGKFVCARNCGQVVYLQKKGRCDGDIGFI